MASKHAVWVRTHGRDFQKSQREAKARGDVMEAQDRADCWERYEWHLREEWPDVDALNGCEVANIKRLLAVAFRAGWQARAGVEARKDFERTADFVAGRKSA